MLTMTKQFKQHLESNFDKEDGYLRIYRTPELCGGELDLSLDQHISKNDNEIKLEGYHFIISKDLLKNTTEIKIDLTETGIKITSPHFSEKG